MGLTGLNDKALHSELACWEGGLTRKRDDDQAEGRDAQDQPGRDVGRAWPLVQHRPQHHHHAGDHRRPQHLPRHMDTLFTADMA